MPRRVTWKVPGYDCMYAPCQHEKKGNHGISGGRWFYAVVADEGDIAVSLSVSAADYPETVPAYLREKYRTENARDPTVHIAFHLTFPTQREDLSRKGVQDCRLVTPCFDPGISGYAYAEKLWRESGQSYQCEPTEGLWLALERELAEEAPKLRVQDARKLWKVCPSCGDTDHPGFVSTLLEG